MYNHENSEFEGTGENKAQSAKKTAGTGLKFGIPLILLVAACIIFNPFYVLNEGETVIITQLGRVVKTETAAGLHFKIPMLHTVHKYTAKLLRIDGDPQKILTKEKQYVVVNTTSRWRITDVRKFYESLVTYGTAFSRLSDIVDSSVRDIITINSIDNVVRSSNIINESTHEEQFNIEDAELKLDNITNEKTVFSEIDKGREILAQEILKKANSQLGEFGLEVIDVIFKQIKYSDELQNSVFNRMIKDRNQIAQTFRSTGEGKKAEWLGKLENEKKTILSKAYSESEKVKGEADARATSIYANAYGKAPEFYSFWKSIEIYGNSLPQTEKVLSTDMEYFKYLYNH